MRLESQPTGSVTVHADPPAGTAVRVTPASRTFTPTTWNTPQAFTVSAVHDADSVDETGLAIAHRVTGADYQGDTVDATVAVTVIDDDIPGIHVVPDPDPAPDPVTVLEGGTLALLVKLTALPAGTVTVTLTPDNSELTLDPATLTFGTGDWETAQTVEVMAAQDDDADDDEVTITGETLSCTLPILNAKSVTEALKPVLARDALLVSDANRCYPPVAAALDIPHETINRSAGERVRGAVHIQTVNSRHSQIKGFLRPFRGIATKYLDSYLRWFHLIELADRPPPRACLTAAMAKPCLRFAN